MHLHIGHSCLTHGYLLCGEKAPVCDVYNAAFIVLHLLVCYRVSHIGMFCFNHSVLPDSAGLKLVLSNSMCLQSLFSFLHISCLI